MRSNENESPLEFTKSRNRRVDMFKVDERARESVIVHESWPRSNESESSSTLNRLIIRHRVTQDWLRVKICYVCLID